MPAPLRIAGSMESLAQILRAFVSEKAAKHGEVLSEYIHQTAIDASEPGDETARRAAHDPLHTEIIATVGDKFVEFFKCAFVEQQRDPLTRREFAGLMLALAALRATSGFRLGGAASQLGYGITGFAGSSRS